MSENPDWGEVTLESVADEVTVGYVGPMASEYVSSGIPFLRSTNIQPYQINLQDVIYISQAFHKKIQKSALFPGDVVIVRTGKPGTAAAIPNNLSVANCSDLVIVRPGRNLDSHFLAYYINSAAQGHIAANIVGAVQQHFNIGSAKQLKLWLPPLPEQRAIARILGALDDKIELNRHMNRTLEGMAQTLFKSWFVDFDPVTRKTEGQTPFGMYANPAALFPAEYVNSELGEIPYGWRVGTVEEVFDLTMGQSPPGETYNEIGEGIAFYQGRTDFGSRYPTARIYCTAPTRFANPGDTLVSVRAPVGDINMALEKCCIGRGLASIRHKSGSRSYTYYAMHFLRDDFDVFEGEGTLFGSISGVGFRNIKIIVPSPEVLAEFEYRISPLDWMIENNERQNVALASIRDALLPRLLSGEVRVKGFNPAKCG
jgi:type I restriction enzyme S subunit